jgi:hypothetical protein
MRSASEKAATVSALRDHGKQMELRAGAKKTLKLTVECLRCSRFAPRSLFNCGIRDQLKPDHPAGNFKQRPQKNNGVHDKPTLFLC